MTDMAVAAVVTELGLERIAHFTPSKNLPHILGDGVISSSKDLAEQAPEYFDPTDIERFDEHPEMVCCSFAYPNAYYLDRARSKPRFRRYPDWVCLLLSADLLTTDGTLFSPCNAAKGRGEYLKPGAEALRACFGLSSPPTHTWTRGPKHHPQASTDLQAEALIPGPIALSHLISIVVPSAMIARDEAVRLEVCGVDPKLFNWVISPTMFKKNSLSSVLRFGGTVEETPWDPEGNR
jgi:hypothetical protein